MRPASRPSRLNRRRNVLEQGIASGEFRPVDLAFVESVLGLFNYTFVWNREGADARPMTTSVMDVLIHGVSAAPSPRTSRHRATVRRKRRADRHGTRLARAGVFFGQSQTHTDAIPLRVPRRLPPPAGLFLASP